LLAGAELFLTYGIEFWSLQKQIAVHIQDDKEREELFEVSMQYCNNS